MLDVIEVSDLGGGVFWVLTFDEPWGLRTVSDSFGKSSGQWLLSSHEGLESV
jgi:hypothetical protein